MENRAFQNIWEVKDYLNGSREHGDYYSYNYAQFIEGNYYNDWKSRLETNVSSMYTQLIKEAARCNRYSSDVIYDIQAFERALETFNPENNLPIIAFGFRKDGVDGNSFVLSRCKNKYDLYKEYFAVYFLEVIEESDYNGSYKVICNGYHT